MIHRRSLWLFVCSVALRSISTRAAQVVSLSHTQIVRSNLSVTETFGFIREKAYTTVTQPFTPIAIRGTACEQLTDSPGSADCTINTFGSNIFPGMTIIWPAYGPVRIPMLHPISRC